MFQPTGAKPKFPMLALVLAFVPSGLVLGGFTLVRLFGSLPPFGTGVVLGVLCFVSLVCCVVSSTMLFARKTSVAIVGGLGLLILNTVISLCLGCTASGAKLLE